LIQKRPLWDIPLARRAGDGIPLDMHAHAFRLTPGTDLRGEL
jgi:hypothetical protein